MTQEMECLRQDYTVNDLTRAMMGANVVGTVAVQARQTMEETEWLLLQAQQSKLIWGVVGWVPLIDARVESWLAQWKLESLLRGVRHVLHDERDEFYILRLDFNAGIACLKRYGLVYDVLIFERHLPQTVELVDRHPHQVFIIDHIAKPKIRERALEPWRSNLRLLAERPNVYCKVSGMCTEANWSNWTALDLEPYFDLVLDAFGASRLMFGSDWPVLTLASGYLKWLGVVAEWLDRLSDAEAQAIRHDNAVRIYGLHRRAS